MDRVGIVYPSAKIMMIRHKARQVGQVTLETASMVVCSFCNQLGLQLVERDMRREQTLLRENSKSQLLLHSVFLTGPIVEHSINRAKEGDDNNR